LSYRGLLAPGTSAFRDRPWRPEPQYMTGYDIVRQGLTVPRGWETRHEE